MFANYGHNNDCSNLSVICAHSDWMSNIHGEVKLTCAPLDYDARLYTEFNNAALLTLSINKINY